MHDFPLKILYIVSMGKASFAFLLAGVLVVAAAVPLYADLGSFREKIEEEEKPREKPPEQEKPKSPPRENRRHDDGDGDASLWELLFHVFFFALEANLSTTYGPYPYCEDGYIRRDGEEPDGKQKNYFFNASASGFYLHGMGGGSWLSFSGNLLRFIGPYADVYAVSDGREVLYGWRAGMHLSLIQSEGFNLAYYLQYQMWLGFMYRNMTVMGLEFRIYPVKPLSLRSKLGVQLLGSGGLGEAELEAGFLIQAWELYAGYRWWSAFGGGRPWHGPFLGLRRHL
jgi:hypothetical protein